jgi:hypothetical protein
MEYYEYLARAERVRRDAIMAVDTAAMPKTEEVNMDDFEGKGQARELHGWVLSPEKRGSLKLVLQYESGSNTAGDREGLVQLLLPPEAALHLADELNRQARRTLDERAHRLAITDASGTGGSSSSLRNRDRKNRQSRAAPKKRPS